MSHETEQYQRAITLFNQCQYTEALQILRGLDEKHPNQPDILYGIARIRQKLGQSDVANKIALRLRDEFGDARGDQLLSEMEQAAKQRANDLQVNLFERSSTHVQVPSVVEGRDTERAKEDTDEKKGLGCVEGLLVAFLSITVTSACIGQWPETSIEFSLYAIPGGMVYFLLRPMVFFLLSPTTLLCMVALGDFGEEDTLFMEFSQSSFSVGADRFVGAVLPVGDYLGDAIQVGSMPRGRAR